MSTVTVNSINDFNQNVVVNDDPRLQGYLPVDYFRVIDTDTSSRRIREPSVSIEQLYDYNIDAPCADHDANNDED